MAEIKDCCSCIYETRSTFTEPCVSCGADFRNYTAKPEPKRKRKTNYDIIRAKTMAEMAVWLSKNDPDCDPPEWWLRWLQQEAET